MRGIRALLSAWKYHEQKDFDKIDFKDLLKKIAFQLRKIREFYYAMVVYQELKMVYRVEECAKKHVDFELDENEKADFYLELCKYYEHIGDD